MDDNFIEDISVLSNFQRLKILSLKNNNLQNIFALLNTLKICQKLKNLKIKNNPLSSDYFTKYSLILKLWNLKHLDEESINDIDREIAVQIKKHFGKFENNNCEMIQSAILKKENKFSFGLRDLTQKAQLSNNLSDIELSKTEKEFTQNNKPWDSDLEKQNMILTK